MVRALRWRSIWCFRGGEGPWHRLFTHFSLECNIQKQGKEAGSQRQSYFFDQKLQADKTLGLTGWHGYKKDTTHFSWGAWELEPSQCLCTALGTSARGDSLAVLNLFVDFFMESCVHFCAILWHLIREDCKFWDTFFSELTNPQKLSLDFRLHGWERICAAAS